MPSIDRLSNSLNVINYFLEIKKHLLSNHGRLADKDKDAVVIIYP